MNLNSGRVNQKQRTRQTLLEATRLLLSKNETFTIDDVAEEAEVSRATVYRYFPNIDTLILETLLVERYKIDFQLFKTGASNNVVERASHLQEIMFSYVQKNELSFRKFLSVVVAQDKNDKVKQKRGGWRLKIIEEAIAPLEPELPETNYKNLKIALATMVGIESHVVGKDVCKHKDEEVKDALNWAIRKLVWAAQQEEE